MSTLKLVAALVLAACAVSTLIMGFVAIATNPGSAVRTGAAICLGLSSSLRLILWLLEPEDEGGEDEGG